MQCSLITPPPPQHVPQAAARLNGGACTFVTTKINVILNTAQSPPKLYTKVLLPQLLLLPRLRELSPDLLISKQTPICLLACLLVLAVSKRPYFGQSSKQRKGLLACLLVYCLYIVNLAVAVVGDRPLVSALISSA